MSIKKEIPIKKEMSEKEKATWYLNSPSDLLVHRV